MMGFVTFVTCPLTSGPTWSRQSAAHDVLWPRCPSLVLVVPDSHIMLLFLAYVLGRHPHAVGVDASDFCGSNLGVRLLLPQESCSRRLSVTTLRPERVSPQIHVLEASPPR